MPTPLLSNFGIAIPRACMRYEAPAYVHARERRQIASPRAVATPARCSSMAARLYIYPPAARNAAACAAATRALAMERFLASAQTAGKVRTLTRLLLR